MNVLNEQEIGREDCTVLVKALIDKVNLRACFQTSCGDTKKLVSNKLFLKIIFLFNFIKKHYKFNLYNNNKI